MSKAVIGDTVKVHYTGRLDDESVFDSSREREPLQFTIGAGQVIPGFEEAVVGLGPGESANTRIEPENAYGPRLDELRITVPRDNLPGDFAVSEGDHLQMRTQEGQVVRVQVLTVAEDAIVVDANHPLAGKPLSFEIELVEIV
jgi:peptidylprolyl isomerase